MNADMLSKLIAMLTPNSALAKAMAAKPILAGPIPQRPKGHQRSGYTKNHNQPRDKARAKMARESRRRNREK